MLTIFNRKELFNIFSQEKQAKLCQLLAQNKIRYTIKTVNRRSSSPFFGGSRARTGTFGERLELQYEYTIFVHKDDYDLASSLLR